MSRGQRRRDSDEGMATKKGVPIKWLAETVDQIVHLYEKWGKPEQADEWHKKRPLAKK